MDTAISREEKQNKKSITKEHPREQERQNSAGLSAAFKTSLWKLHPFQAFGFLLRSVFPSYPQSGHSTVEASLQASASGVPNCQSYHQPAVAMSLLSISLPPVHSGCPLGGTNPNQRWSLVHSLPWNLQSPYLLGTRLSQGLCCRVEAHGRFWRAAAILRPATVCRALLSRLISHSPSQQIPNAFQYFIPFLGEDLSKGR